MEAYVSSGEEIPTFLSEMEGRLRNRFFWTFMEIKSPKSNQVYRLRNTFAYPEDESQELLAVPVCDSLINFVFSSRVD